MLFKIAGAIMDSSIIFVLISLLGRNYRIIGNIAVFVLMVIVLSNLLFFRSFNDLIPSSAYFNSQITDPTVIRGGIVAFRHSDILLICAGLLPSVTYFFTDKSKEHFKKYQKNAILIGLIFLSGSFIISVCGTYRRLSIHKGYFSFSEITEDIFSKEISDWKTSYRNLNFTGYMWRCLLDACNPAYHALTEEENQKIISRLTKKSQQITIPEIKPDSLPKNLIIIIVESLESNALHKSSEIFPVLSKLIRDTTNIYIDKCRVLADYGRSSDAQFIINTGLLPLRGEALVNRYAINDYPSLSKALKMNSIEIIGEEKSLWSHGLTSRSYGFGCLVDNAAPEDMNQDSLIFRVAGKHLAAKPEPFFMMITTLSMHDPYIRNNVSTNIPMNFKDKRDKEYFNRLNHFDNALGHFIDKLKDMGIFEDTMIVVVGDHEIRYGTTSFPMDSYVPLIIINSPIPRNQYRKENITQLDIFPTILYLMGKEMEFFGVNYKGLGTNIFNLNTDSVNTDSANTDSANTDSAIDEEDYAISDLIIRRKF